MATRKKYGISIDKGIVCNMVEEFSSIQKMFDGLQNEIYLDKEISFWVWNGYYWTIGE
ncbi:MAG: hypothetical protein WA061_02015 [Microgenomates group bacterium]